MKQKIENYLLSFLEMGMAFFPGMVMLQNLSCFPCFYQTMDELHVSLSEMGMAMVFLALALFTYVRFPWSSITFGFDNPLIFSYILLMGSLSIFPVFLGVLLFFLLRRLIFFRKLRLNLRSLSSNLIRYAFSTFITVLFYEEIGGKFNFSQFSSTLFFPLAAAIFFHILMDFLTFLLQAKQFKETFSFKEIGSGYALELPFYLLAPFVPIIKHVLSAPLFLFVPFSLFVVFFVFKFGFKSYIEKEKLQIIYELSKRLSSALDFQGMAPEILTSLTEKLKASGGSIYLRDKDLFRRGASCGIFQQNFLPGSLVEKDFFDEKGGAARVVTHPTALFPQPLLPLAVMPLKTEKETLGYLLLSRPFIGEEQEKFLTILAGQLSSSIHNSFLFKEVVEANIQLKAMQAQLIETSKLAAVGQLAAGVAHEINNPLGAILLNAWQLQKKPEDGDAVETIIQASQRCQNIIQKLLNFSRKSQDEKKNFKLEEVVKVALNLWNRQLSLDNIQVKIDFQETMPIYGVPENLVQVLANLISNARDAILEKKERSGKIQINTFGDSRESCLSFSDNGCGILEENLPKIFDPFFTTKEIGKGTGLGLSVSYGIVKSMGGEIQVESRKGEGSQFVLKFSAAKDEEKSHSAEDSVIDRALNQI